MIRRLLFALLLVVPPGCMSATPLVLPPVITADVPPQRPFNYPIIQLAGSPEQMGEQQGNELRGSIRLLHDKYLGVFMQNQTQKLMGVAVATLFEAQLSPAHRQELAALASAAGLDEHEAMLGQCFLDMSKLSACSTISLPASASPDHIARFGRNLDFWSLNIADQYTTLFIVKPTDGRYAYAAVGWPGMIGVLSGMNQHGLCLANMEVPRSPRFPSAMPYTILYRTVLEKCRTVDEAITLLQKTPIQTANNLMLMDAQGNRAVAELSPDAVHIRRPAADSALISTNHQRDQDADSPGRCVRYDYLHTTAAENFGKIGQMQMQGMLGHVGSKITLQSMVFEPENRVLYLSAGTDAAHQPYSRIDLKPFFH